MPHRLPRRVAAIWFAAAGASSVLGAEPLRLSFDDVSVSVTAGDRVVMRYRYADVPFKPYVERLYSPAGLQVLRDSPSDHKHHHALMFAAAVDGVNYWEEAEKCGRQVHRAFADVGFREIEGVRVASFAEHLHWTPDGKEVALLERRTLEVYAGGDLGVTLLTWRSLFARPPGKAPATLGGRNYYGLGARFLTSMDTGGAFLLPDGASAALATNDSRGRWCAYTAAAEGKPVTLAMFDHSANPHHPASWFTMTTPFAYLCATLNLDDQPVTLAADSPLGLTYGVALFDGKVEPSRIEALWKRWPRLAARE